MAAELYRKTALGDLSVMELIDKHKIQPPYTFAISKFSHKQLEMYGCIFNSVATGGLVLKHQSISIHKAD